MDYQHRLKQVPRRVVLGSMTILALGLSACAGSAGQGPEEASGAQSQGFEYGASQEDVSEAIRELEPVTITYQTGAASPESNVQAGPIVKEYIEERSEGKITVDIIWGQAVAGLMDVPDALADGRLDIAYSLLPYLPSEYPAVDDLGTITSALPPTPLYGELLNQAVVTELAWNSEAIQTSLADNDLTPLVPAVNTGMFFSLCSTPTASAADWEGLQVRIGSPAQAAQVQNLGATPVSLEASETFEALQRNTVDCTLTIGATIPESGLLEVAPFMGYSSTASYPRMVGSDLAGPSISELPIAYQQIIFDGFNLAAMDGHMDAIINGLHAGITNIDEFDGEVQSYEPAIQEEIADYSQILLEEATDTSYWSDAVQGEMEQAVETWGPLLEELSYLDDGEFEDMGEWYDPATDFTPFAEALYTQGPGIEHRPR